MISCRTPFLPQTYEFWYISEYLLSPSLRLSSTCTSADVTAALTHQLAQSSDVTRLRALVLLDCLLQAGCDGGAALAEAVGSLAEGASDDTVRVKALKVGRIMERLGV